MRRLVGEEVILGEVKPHSKEVEPKKVVCASCMCGVGK